MSLETETLHSRRSIGFTMLIWAMGTVLTGLGILFILGVALALTGGATTTMNLAEKAILATVAIIATLLGLSLLLQTSRRTLTFKDGSLTLDGILKFVTHPITIRTDDIGEIAIYQTISNSVGPWYLVLFDKTGKPFPLNLHPFSLEERLKLAPLLQSLIQDPTIKKPNVDAVVRMNRLFTVWFGEQHGIDLAGVKKQDHPLETPPPAEVAKNWLKVLLVLALVVGVGKILSSKAHMTYADFKMLFAALVGIPLLLLLAWICLQRLRIYIPMFF